MKLLLKYRVNSSCCGLALELCVSINVSPSANVCPIIIQKSYFNIFLPKLLIDARIRDPVNEIVLLLRSISSGVKDIPIFRVSKPFGVPMGDRAESH
jgi:hypothetical protein